MTKNLKLLVSVVFVADNALCQGSKMFSIFATAFVP